MTEIITTEEHHILIWLPESTDLNLWKYVSH